jgi:hypothetical protein
MLWTALRRATTVLQIAALGVLAGVSASHAADRGFEALNAAAPAVPAVGKVLPAPDASPSGTCPGTNVEQCFDTGGSHNSFVNVGTFFDRQARTTSTHYFAKLFTPATPGRYQIQSISFVANRAQATFPSAGVVLTSAETPIFPTNEQLVRLQVKPVASAGASVETCVDLTGGNVILEAGQAAWLVLNFPEAADSVFIGVRAETDTAGAAADHPCDFMTRDAGEYWFRPDPLQSPYDWAIAAYYDALPAAPRQTWSQVKTLYR